MALAGWRRIGAAAALGVLVLWGAREAWSARAVPVAAPILVTDAFVARSDTLQDGETLSHLFGRHDIAGSDLLALLDAAAGLDPRRVRAGQVFDFRSPVDTPRPDWIETRLGDEQILTLTSSASGRWSAHAEPIRWTVEAEQVSGAIASTLYETLESIVPDSVLDGEERGRLAWDLADGVYGWVVDFTRDIRPGDSLEVVFERLASQFGDIRFGRVLAARLTTAGVVHPAYVMTGPKGRNEYYDAKGRSLRRAFKMYPVAFRYISSGFSRARLHPILKVRRPHLGVDYRAAAGTPITVTADGIVSRAGRWGGYGIMVAVRHVKGIETRYAHMRSLAPGIRPGVRVRQGQTIGYVGMTGLATAPHVHYEFIQGGRHVNPRTALRFGTGEPVPAARRGEFEALRRYYDRLLEGVPAQPTVASGDH